MESPFATQVVDPQDTSDLSNVCQSALLIHGPGEEYKLTKAQDIPQPRIGNEILIKVVAVGLNPVDWKGPDYNFGLPALPWINGRDLAGVVVKAPKGLLRIKVGDVVLTPSTDYRDIRKAAFQEYVISAEHNSARIPRHLSPQTGAVVGVAFVTSALSLGICLGVNFARPTHTSAPKGPDPYSLVRQVDQKLLADDIQDECMRGIEEHERARKGDWIAIWGASSATGLLALQLAKLVGLRTICVVDVARYGEKLLASGADLLVDRLDTERAVSIIRGVTQGQLRFALDTVGRETAEKLQQALGDGVRSHLVGLTGLPKEKPETVQHHKVPIKAFHDVPEIGESLMAWLEQLLLTKRLTVPDIETARGGLEGINSALDLLRSGTVTGKRVVVPIQKSTAIAV